VNIAKFSPLGFLFSLQGGPSDALYEVQRLRGSRQNQPRADKLLLGDGRLRRRFARIDVNHSPGTP
jgi:hypothetical protein